MGPAGSGGTVLSADARISREQAAVRSRRALPEHVVPTLPRDVCAGVAADPCVQADTSVGPYGFVRTQGTKLRHVVHSPTFTTARESGEYCQQTACVFS